MLVLVLVGLLVVGIGAAFMLSGDDGSGQDDAGPTTQPRDQGGSEPNAEDTEDAEDVAGGDGGTAPTGGASPEEAVQGYIDAIVAGDCEAIVAHLTENMMSGTDRGTAVDECESTAENQAETASIMSSLELSPADEEEGTARVEGHADYQGSTLVIVFTVVQDGDAWLIDDVA